MVSENLFLSFLITSVRHNFRISTSDVSNVDEKRTHTKPEKLRGGQHGGP